MKQLKKLYHTHPMNQKCFHKYCFAYEVPEYVNELIKKGWKIISLSTSSNGDKVDAVVLAEVANAAPKKW